MDTLFLPHLAAAIRRASHGFTCFAAIGGSEFFKIRQRTVDSKSRKRMRIAERLLALGFLTLACRPRHSPTDEETLLWRKPIDVFQAWFTPHGFHQRAIRDR